MSIKKKIGNKLNGLVRRSHWFNEELFPDCQKFWKYNTAVRAIRVCTFNLSEASKTQLCMFSNEIKKIKINYCIYYIKKRIEHYYSILSYELKNTFLIR